MRLRLVSLVTVCLLACGVHGQYVPPTVGELTAAPLAKDQKIADAHGNLLSVDEIIDMWIADAAPDPNAKRVFWKLKCVVGGQQRDCLFVPKYNASDRCITRDPPSYTALDFGKCDVPADQQDGSAFCMVTDELSQAAIALAARLKNRPVEPEAFDLLVNTIRAIRRTTAPKLPLWNVRVTIANGVATITPVTTDDASDATARIILALFIAASSDQFSDAKRAEYRDLADQLASDFKSDFIDKPVMVNGRTLRYWLGSGWNTVFGRTSPVCTGSECNNPFGWAGYHGDVAIALLAAYAGAKSDNATYLQMARDTIHLYLLSAGFSSAFRVPPVSYNWVTTQSGLASSCKNSDGWCNPSDTCSNKIAWDWADAPRATSVCKAKYYARLLGVDLGVDSLLDAYCGKWIDAGFSTSPYEYSRRYALNGTPCGKTDGYVDNALGSLVHFAYGRPSFGGRLAAVFRHFYTSATPPRFDPGDNQKYRCLGIYDPAFAVTSFVTAVGRDRGAFAPPIQLNAVWNGAAVQVTWTAALAGTSYLLERSTDGNTWSPRGTTGGTFLEDSAAANTAYLYRVRATLPAGDVLLSNRDLATTVAFENDPLTAGTVIRRTHHSQLRTAVNSVRTLAGLPAVGSDVVLQAKVRAIDLTTLRDGLAPALASLGQKPMVVCTPSLAGAVIRACDVSGVRDAMR